MRSATCYLNTWLAVASNAPSLVLWQDRGRPPRIATKLGGTRVRAITDTKAKPESSAKPEK